MFYIVLYHRRVGGLLSLSLRYNNCIVWSLDVAQCGCGKGCGIVKILCTLHKARESDGIALRAFVTLCAVTC